MLKGEKGAWTVTVGDKGQIVIPVEARKMFDINPRDTILIIGDKNQGLAIIPKAKMEKVMNSIFNNKEEEGK